MIVFVSDVHLGRADDELTRAFVSWLKLCQRAEVKELYVMGDLFDVWLGDDFMLAEAKSVTKAFANLAQSGCYIGLQYGNRDFLLGDEFMNASNCELLPDEFLLERAEQRILLLHGDTLCTGDTEYQKLHSVLRSKNFRRTFLDKAKEERIKEAENLLSASSEATRKKNMDDLGVSEQAVVDALERHRANFMIHGHTHQAGEHKIKLRGRYARRLVLGAWENRMVDFICLAAGSFKAVRLDFDSFFTSNTLLPTNE